MAGSFNDRDVFNKLGYSNVTISNLDTRIEDQRRYRGHRQEVIDWRELRNPRGRMRSIVDYGRVYRRLSDFIRSPTMNDVMQYVGYPSVIRYIDDIFNRRIRIRISTIHAKDGILHNLRKISKCLQTLRNIIDESRRAGNEVHLRPIRGGRISKNKKQIISGLLLIETKEDKTEEPVTLELWQYSRKKDEMKLVSKLPNN